MSRTPAPTLQLLTWLAEQSRSYAETIEVWKTSCPRLSVWEDAVADGLVRIERGCVQLTAAGGELLGDVCGFDVPEPSGSAAAAAGHEARQRHAPAGGASVGEAVERRLKARHEAPGVADGQAEEP